MIYQNICVFCGASERVDEKYRALAQEFAREIGITKRQLIYGGGNSGLMGEVSRTAKHHGAKVTGIFPVVIEKVESHDQNEIDELIFVESLFARKELMLQKSDVFVVLPGGFGTLDELFEVVTLKNLGVGIVKDKPLIILNSDGFWDHLESLFEKVIEEKFAQQQIKSNYEFVTNLQELLLLL